MPSANSKAAIRLAQRLRTEMTEGERQLWQALKHWRKHYGLHVQRQAPVGPYVADFLINSKRVVIELDGEHHFTNEGMKKDRKRDAWFAQHGYKTIHLSTGELAESFDGTVEKIMHEVGVL